MRLAALTDWDGTLQRGFIHLDWVMFLAAHGCFHHATVERMREVFARYHAGSLPYDDMATQVIDLYATGLHGTPVADTLDLARRFVEARAGLWPFVPTFFALLHERRIDVVVISGAPRILLDRYGARFGLAEIVAVEIGTADGRWTGEVTANPSTLPAKRRAVASIARRYDIVLAVGDSHADTPLFEAAPHALLLIPPGTNAPPAGLPAHTRIVTPETILEAVRAALSAAGATH